ncbi:MAG: biotin--[acetyl-CoA-carboxylase] ligase [Clostridiales Family XIII bacterium]|jgi:BirA family biotin operon repressor/biotin-[acetyl-CoA-carboxylase] ligase|nr:biotin--[acetyl-CoA-carboxylase] ligase [Clostridiales Family XIII bacterium]
MDNYDEKEIPRADKHADKTHPEQTVQQRSSVSFAHDGRCSIPSCNATKAAQHETSLAGLARGLVAYETIDSTNDEAKRLIAASPTPADIPFGTVVVADEQTAGRGRLGRVFASPAADSVYMSFILRPVGAITDTLLITFMAAVATCEAIEAIAGGEPRIKWVNDIYMEGKKVCGILSEGVSAPGSAAIDAIALGIGVNINVPQSDFPEEIRAVAGSVEMNPGDQRRFVAELIQRVNVGYDKLARGISPIESYREKSFVIGKEITVIKAGGSEAPAIAEGIADDGSLLARYENGNLEHLISGEISLKIREIERRVE